MAAGSAGGGLSIATLLAAGAAGLPQPAAVVLFSPWTDLTLDRPHPLRRQHPLQGGRRPDIHRGRRARVRGSPRRCGRPGAPPWPARSPATSPGCPRCSCRPARERGAARRRGAAGRAGADGVEVTLEVGPGLPHVFQHHYGRLEEADAALDRAARFLTNRLRRAP
ncbi:alpha/beta hydrolase fold domain-containing protein [Streptomyces ardesiacus]|uniref:Alpha/beta hydrolase fold domain-containing protein n=1 Tax=Streptomyces ardesiacus TaxID=285564 RepID=A0ABW8H6V8_9ACTN